ncbi:acetate/propionate family kinase [Pedobacter sp. SL55]|uniref:acetate/propionate family kinase n=1 Tax=Pedobacter sp. SL55 TaxID=2995161 RepID=UPI00226F4D0D|nr:acetate/propionate family kinase [Pedobacter sp. SL55]WAC39396.1 acetate/propionate family kinase [Pedobacter sp. SL55]
MDILKSKTSNGLILVLNLGSSSLKFSIIHQISLERKYKGEVIGLDSREVVMVIHADENKYHFKKILASVDLKGCMQSIIEWMHGEIDSTEIVAIGYRVVQGGPKHTHPERISEKLLKDLESYVYLAPNHLPDEIKLIRTFRNSFIGIPHFACFDTYFHKDMPIHAKFYPLPDKYKEIGLMRYGFHGLSYESIFQQLLEEDVDIKNQKIIIAHLGSGSSMVAIGGGFGKDTTMGISPMGGLAMATRSGDLDPGAILFLFKQDQLSTDDLDELLSKESGLKAIAGSSDMREIIAKRKRYPKAAEALEIFCYQAKKQIGAYAAALGGINLLVFCGGIGENAALVREKICIDMGFIGITLDLRANVKADPIISVSNSKVTVRLMKTDEELMIAFHAQQLLSL